MAEPPADVAPPSHRARGLINATAVAAIIIAIGSSAVAVVGWVNDNSVEDASAKGAARLMHSEFLERYCDLGAILNRMKWPRADVVTRVRNSAEQRLQVAARMSRADWSAVTLAEVSIPRAERLLERRRGVPFDRPGRTRSQRAAIASDVAALVDYRRSFERAFSALSGQQAADAFAAVDIDKACPPETSLG